MTPTSCPSCGKSLENHAISDLVNCGLKVLNKDSRKDLVKQNG